MIEQFSAHDRYWVGYDCGQSQDYSALAILKKCDSRYDVVRLERLQLNMPYPAQIEHVFELMHRNPLHRANKVLAIDYTGVGRPVVDLAQDRGLSPIGITITSGNAVSWNKERNRAKVPKRDLVSIMQIFAQNDRLKVANGLKVGPILAAELQSFKVKIDVRTAHDSYGSWREGEHDDLILATAIALWTAENQNKTDVPIARFVSHVGRGR